VQKIPQAVLHKCEWGKDDYSLNVAALREPNINDDEPEVLSEEEALAEELIQTSLL
jgi:adenine-specific DNA-methyltransferase